MKKTIFVAAAAFAIAAPAMAQELNSEQRAILQQLQAEGAAQRGGPAPTGAITDQSYSGGKVGKTPAPVVQPSAPKCPTRCVARWKMPDGTWAEMPL